MKIKGEYLATDVSYYEPADSYNGTWDKASPRPHYIIARASYGTANDSAFLEHWKQAVALGIRRGAYHYFYAYPYSNRFTPEEHVGNQAQAFIKQLRLGNFDPKYDTLWMDWETAGNEKFINAETLSSRMKQWLDHVERETGVRPGIYSRKDQLERMMRKNSMPEWIKEYDLWLAYYGVSSQIDNIHEIPPRYLPAWMKPERLAMWQYSEKFQFEGLRSYYDINKVYPAFAEKIALGAPTPPPEPMPEPDPEPSETTSLLFDGAVVYKKWLEGATPCHLLKIDLARATPKVSYPPRLMKTLDRIRTERFHIAINCDGWYVRRSGKGWMVIPAGFNASNGKAYGALGTEETMFISADGNWSMQKPKSIYTAFGITNMLVKGGVKLPITAKRTDKDPRSAFGLSRDRQYVYLLVADGIERRKDGLDYNQVADIFIDAGCDLAGMLDGGGSSTLAVRNGEIAALLNDPCGEEPDGQRMVMNCLGFIIKG